MKKKFGLFITFIALLSVSFEFMRYYGVYPSRTFYQIYWHMTHKSVIENENLELKLPIKWILGKETSNQYLLIGGYRGDKEAGILKTITFLTEPIKKETVVGIGNEVNCLPRYEKIVVKDNTFELYGCRKHKQYPSVAIIFDVNYTFNMIVDDYEDSDKEDIIDLLGALKFHS